jgi:hypothetical protein
VRAHGHWVVLHKDRTLGRDVPLRSETPAVKTKLQGKPELTAEFEAARGAPVHLTIDLGKWTITW